MQYSGHNTPLGHNTYRSHTGLSQHDGLGEYCGPHTAPLCFLYYFIQIILIIRWCTLFVEVLLTLRGDVKIPHTWMTKTC